VDSRLATGWPRPWWGPLARFLPLSFLAIPTPENMYFYVFGCILYTYVVLHLWLYYHWYQYWDAGEKNG
jgi:hypothetical protein